MRIKQYHVTRFNQTCIATTIDGPEDMEIATSKITRPYGRGAEWDVLGKISAEGLRRSLKAEGMDDKAVEDTIQRKLKEADVTLEELIARRRLTWEDVRVEVEEYAWDAIWELGVTGGFELVAVETRNGIIIPDGTSDGMATADSNSENSTPVAEWIEKTYWLKRQLGPFESEGV